MVSKVLHLQRKKGDKRQLFSGEQVFLQVSEEHCGIFHHTCFSKFFGKERLAQ
jgi:hypothetical protein